VNFLILILGFLVSSEVSVGLSRTDSANTQSNKSEGRKHSDYFPVGDTNETEKPKRMTSGRLTNSSWNSSQIDETTIDDLSLLDCSKYLRIREITIFSDDFISGIILKYRLPTGEVIQSDHSINVHKNQGIKTKEDIYEWKSMSLDPEESIIHISCGY
jgi:hypothetical protein